MTDRSVSIHFGKMRGMDLSGKGMELELTANGIVLRTDLNWIGLIANFMVCLSVPTYNFKN